MYIINMLGNSTGYRLDGPEIESRWGRDFLHQSRAALAPPPSFLHIGYRVVSRGKATGGVALTTHPIQRLG